MKIELQYGNTVLTLPGAALSLLSTAGDAELRLLLLLCGDPALREDFDRAAAAERLELSVGEVDTALAFWRGAGILKLPKAGRKASAETSAETSAEVPVETGAEGDASESLANNAMEPVTVVRSDSEVHYTGQELDELVAKRQELRWLLEESQKIAGKVFSTAESCKVITLADYYGLSTEYLLLLFQYCRTIDKCTVPYAYRTGQELFRQGITTVEQLEEYLKTEEQRQTLESKLRGLLGIGKRTITAKEKRFFTEWAKNGHSFELISLAYEQNVDATGEWSLPYMNKILSKWKEQGIDSPGAVQTAEAAYRAAKNQASNGESAGTAGSGGKSSGGSPRKKAGGRSEFRSFDADEFFKTALQKSDATPTDPNEK